MVSTADMKHILSIYHNEKLFQITILINLIDLNHTQSFYLRNTE